MDASWFIILISVSIVALLIKAFIFPSKVRNKLPPGPFFFPLIGTLPWLAKSPREIERILVKLHAKLGPIVTVPIGSRPSIFISDHSLAHKALVQNGAIFADRPPALPVVKVITKDQRNIVTGFYGPTWRFFRRNLTSEILHPSRVRAYRDARRWVLQILMDRLVSESQDETVISVVDHLQYAMFCVSVLMCFGDKLDHDQIRLVEKVQRCRILSLRRFSILNIFPMVTKIVFRKKWDEFLQSLKDQENTLFPLIRARKKMIEERLLNSKENQDQDHVLCYVDTLFDLQLPGENRKLNEEEIYTLCSEFLTGGTDTTSSALQFIMANLVKYPRIQEKLYMEIKGVVEGNREVKEEDLNKIPYLKAVILEGLRRHPPGNFVVPHAVTEDFTLDGYMIPKNANVNFLVGQMGRDPRVWEDPMEFKPERFMKVSDGSGRRMLEDLDLTGSREIKMMPFGAGRRICPGLSLAMLHLEYFVANLVWGFEWKAAAEVDLSEKQEFSILLKNPLLVNVSPRNGSSV